MMTGRYNKARHEFGKQGEAEVLPLIEAVIGELIRPTEKHYDTMDGESDNFWIEVKTRTSAYHYTDAVIEKEGWLIPACKIERAKIERKRVRFYYFWRKDNSLWELEFSPEVIADLKPRVPYFHKDKQLHYYIPGSRWTRIEFVESLST